MSEMIIQKESLVAMADAIRESTGETKLYSLDEMYEKLCPDFIYMLTEDNYTVTSLPNYITKIRDGLFYNSNIVSILLPESIIEIGDHVFMNCHKLREITFKGTPNAIGDFIFIGCSNITTINVPWSEGEVVGAPWGAAASVTINYNYAI